MAEKAFRGVLENLYEAIDILGLLEGRFTSWWAIGLELSQAVKKFSHVDHSKPVVHA
jgi:hypothetical protein